MKSIRVLIVDDHEIVRIGLRLLIETEPTMEVVGDASEGKEAVHLAHTAKPDVILMDLVMPGSDGLYAIHEIKKFDQNVRILVLTSFAEDDKVFPAIMAGAHGYLLKDTSPQQLLDSIRDVYQGGCSLHPDVALKLVHELKKPSDTSIVSDSLTSRERDILKLVARGLTNRDIATRLTIGESTVRTHVHSILSKLHLANRTQAALFAMHEGLVSQDDD